MNSQLPAPAGRQLQNLGVGTAVAAPDRPRYEVIQHEPLIDARSIWRAMYRNRYLIIGIVAGCMLLGVISLLVSPRIYEANAKIEIGEEQDVPVGPNDSRQPPQDDADRVLQTQIDLLNTRDMAQSVLKRIASQGPRQAEFARQYAPDDVQSGLTIYLPRNSRIVSIAYDDTNPNIAALFANNYAAALIDTNMQTRFNRSADARTFLQGQLNIAKGRLEQSERALLNYARSVGLLDVSGGTDNPQQAIRSLTTSDLVQINTAYAEAKTNRIQAQQRWQTAQATPVMSLPEVLSNSSIQQLTQQKAQLQAKLQEDRQRYKDEHPLVQQEIANIAELDRQIATLAASVKASIRDQYMTAARQESALAGNVGALKGQTLSEQDRSVQYNILKRESDTNRELYEGLLQRYKEVSAQAGSTINNISIVDRAYASPFPVSPSAKKNLSLAAVAGVILAFLIVFMKERMDSRVADPELVDKDVTVPLLAVMPRLKTPEALRETVLDPTSPFFEACHSLRTAIELGCDGLAPSTILFSSTKAQEGKSTTSLGLACAFAEAGDRVLLIDGDLRRPNLHRLLSVENTQGFADLLAGRADLHGTIVRVGDFGIDLLAAGRVRGNAAALLDPHKISEMLIDASATYDRIIIDGPPAVGIADAALLAAAAAATILIVKSDGVTKEEARFAVRRLESEQSNIIGAVLTMFDPHRFGAAYRYQYGNAYPVAATA